MTTMMLGRTQNEVQHKNSNSVSNYRIPDRLVDRSNSTLNFLTLLKLKLQGRTWKTKDGIRVVVTPWALEAIRSYKK